MHSGDILIVDDEESVLITMQAILEMDGYAVQTCSKGQHALKLLRHRSFDLVLTDLRLDDLDGLTILSEIRRTSPDTVAIMLTGYASLESAVQALREGAYDYLFKPCDVDELKATVARGIERRQLAAALHARMAELETANETIRSMNADLERRVDEATASLTQRVDELARARDEIAALHAQAEQHVEELQQLDRLKSQFLSMASHELKTPLTVISGYLQVALRRATRRLDRGRPDEQEWVEEQRKQVEQLEVVTNQAFKLARLVDELLDVSRIESGKMEFHFAPLDVQELAEDVVARMRMTTSKHDIRLVVEDTVGVAVSGDRDHLERVLTNLIGNAIKYSPAGGTVTVGVQVEDGSVLLRVEDQGIGIPAGELDAIFSLFYRVQAGLTKQASGMGLGLYISKEIVSRHGGRIWATSRMGQGSTFYVSLPRVAAPEASLAATA